jgi:hypothetical protein
LLTASPKSTRTLTQSRWLGVLVAVWLNLAVQPCAMALGLDDGCPHCPPMDHEAMDAHHGHHAEEADAGCDSPLSDCGESDDFSIDGRFFFSKSKDTVDDSEAIVVAPAAAQPGTVGFTTTAADPPRPVGAPPPLYLLNCVFLD